METTYILIKLARINKLIAADLTIEAMQAVLDLMDDLTAEDRKEVKHG